MHQSGISKDEFVAGLNSALPGESIVYFTRRNLGDADESTRETAKEARERFAKGEIELAQRRLKDGKLEYLAQKRAKAVVPRLADGTSWVPLITSYSVTYGR
jgi:hypothetical protein